MKRSELILVGTWIIFLLLKGVDYTGGTLWFVLSTFALCLYYLISGFMIFKSEGNSSLIIPILAGLSLATSIITIPYNIFLRDWDWLQALPFINIIFTTFLAGLAGFKWIKKQKSKGTTS